MEDKGYHNEWETLNAGEDVKEVSQLVMKKRIIKFLLNECELFCDTGSNTKRMVM